MELRKSYRNKGIYRFGKSKNNKVVKATYNKKRKAIILEAAGEGSTEIVITAKKGHLWWKKTATQEISVTVTSAN